MSQITNYTTLKDLLVRLEAIKADVIVIIDKNVSTIYKSSFSIYFQNRCVIEIEGSEVSKSWGVLEDLCEKILAHGINRKTKLLAIGGGVTTDLAGLVAALLLRGIDWLAIPTTLLAQIDAAIGGKVAINSSQSGKNLIGAFHEPSEVLICSDFLKTLPPIELQSGQGELAKYIFLSHDVRVEFDQRKTWQETVSKCAQFKVDIVKKDFKELGLRKCLNLGHTFGHALEWYYKIPHGLSVVWGMAILFIIENNDKQLDRLRAIIHWLKLSEISPPWKTQSFDVDKILELMIKDKKALSSKEIEFVVIDDKDEVVFKPLSVEILKCKLQQSKEIIDAFSFN